MNDQIIIINKLFFILNIKKKKKKKKKKVLYWFIQIFDLIHRIELKYSNKKKL